MLHLLHGADTFRSRARLRELRASLDPMDLTASRSIPRTRRSMPCARPAMRCRSSAVGVASMCAACCRRGKSAKGPSAAAMPSRAKGAADPFEALATYLPLMPPTTTLILWEPGPYDPPAALKRALQALGKGSRTSASTRHSGANCRDWAIDRARAVRSTLRPDAADALLDATCPHGWHEIRAGVMRPCPISSGSTPRFRSWRPPPSAGSRRRSRPATSRR